MVLPFYSSLIKDVIHITCNKQDGHKPGKPGILKDLSEHGKLREFCATS